MLANLLFFFLFETVQPSYSTFTALLPEEIIVSAGAPNLASENQPRKLGESLGPVVQAETIYSVDLETGSPLLVRNIFERRPIASIAKLITAMVILDRHQLNEKVIVSKNAADEEGSKMWLREGEEIIMENLLTGLLVSSGNDAAVALAEFDAGGEAAKNGEAVKSGEAAFVKKMNAKAMALGLRDTHFSNVKGFDEDTNYSTAFDTMMFSRAALKYPFIRKTVALKNTEVTSASGKTKHRLESTNELLENPYFKVIGLKTGRTPAAGQSFVSLMQGPNGHEILTVLLDSPDRFKETKIVLDWILRNYEFP